MKAARLALLVSLLALAVMAVCPASSPAVPHGPVPLADGWQFRLDPGDRGLALGWASPTAAFQPEREISTGRSLADQGIPKYTGISWFRRWVDVPAGWSRVVLGFGGLDVACDLYVNGHSMGHFDDAELGQNAGHVDLTRVAQPGTRALIVFRLKGTGGFGGIKQVVQLGQDESQVMTGLQYGLFLHQQHPDWRLPAWTSGGPRAWTIAAVEGSSSKAVVATDGSFSPWAGSYGISIWLYDPVGARLVDFPMPVARLAAGIAPLPIFDFESGPWHLREELAAAGPPADQAVSTRITLLDAPNDAYLYAAVRPYAASGGMASIERAEFKNGAVWVNGRLALAPGPGVELSGGALSAGDASALAQRGIVPAASAANDANGHAQALARLALKPGQPVTLLAPSVPMVQTPPAADFEALTDAWQRRVDAVELDLPDRMMQQAFYASLAYILADKRGDRIHPGPLVHDAFWVRDAALIGYALERAGLADAARGSAEGILRAIAPDGQVTAVSDSAGRPLPHTELDAPGEAVFGLVEFARYAHDTPFLQRAYPRAEAALAYALAHRDASGLLPPNESAEDLGAADQQHYWDDLWLLTGLREASSAAASLGRADDARQFNVQFEQVRADLLASIARTGSPIIPNGPEDLDGTAMARGTSPALWPLRVLDPTSPLVRRSFDAYYARFIQPYGGAYKHLYGQWWPYGGLEIAHDLLFMGHSQEADHILQYTLKHQTAPGLFAWAEGVDGNGGFGEGDMPHAWASAELVNLVRDTLLYEDGNKLVIGAGVPPSWAGQSWSIRRAPTQWGEADVSASQDGTVTVGGVHPPGGVELRLPFAAHLAAS